MYSINIIQASIYVENAESDSAGRIQLDSAFPTYNLACKCSINIIQASIYVENADSDS